MHPSERRRHPRYATSRRATVRGDGASWPGEIRDFCRTGLSVAFERPAPPETVDALARRGAATVEFPAPGASGAQLLRVTGRVVRSTRTGLALQVDELSPEAFRALVAAARHAADAARAADPRPGPASHGRLREDCAAHLAGLLDALLRELASRVPDALEEEARTVGPDTRARLQNEAADFRARREDLAARWSRAMREALESPGGPPPAARDDDSIELALVDDADFEDWLGMSTVIHRIECELGPALATLHRRHGALRGVAFERDTDPLAPASIGRCLRESLRAAGVPGSVRAIAYGAFGEVLATLAPAFYERVNGTLASLEPSTQRAPQARAEPGVQRPRADAPPPAWPPSGAAHGPGPAAPMPQHPPAGAYGPGEAPPQGWSAPPVPPAGWGGAPYGAPGADGVLPPPAAVSGPARALPPTPPACGAPAADPLELLERIRSAGAGTAPADAATAHAGTVAPAGPQPAAGPADPLLRAIDALPPVAAACGAPPRPLVERLGEALAGAPAASPAAGRLRATAGLIDRAFAEPGLGGDVLRLLQRLERPLLGLVLDEGGFPAAPAHPARRAVDLLERSAVAADEDGRVRDPELARALETLVARVAGNADADACGHACDEVERRLAPMRDARQRRIARLQQECEARERVRRARRRVDDAIAARLDDREVPAPLARLVREAWRQHLLLLELRDAGDAARDEALAELDRLDAWLRPGHEPGPDFRRAAAAAAGRIASAVSSIVVDAAQRDALVASVEGALEAVADGLGAPAAVRWARESRDEDAADPGLVAWAEGLRLGDWWLLPREDGTSRPMQLVWTSRPAARCAFAGRSAHERVELSIAELSRGTGDGAVRRCADLDAPLLERAEAALLDEGREALMRRALHDPVSGLPNRKGLMRAMSGAARGRLGTVGIVEFDGLRMIWTACGVEAAEALTRELADAVRGCIGPRALLASFRDDAFAFVLPDDDAGVAAADDPAASAEDPARAVCRALIERLGDHRVRHGEQSWRLGVAVGLAPATDGVGIDETVRRAEAACAAARTLGRNRLHVWEADSAPVRRHESIVDWAGRIDRLLEGSGLSLRCQRIEPVGPDPGLRPYYEVLLGVEVEPGTIGSPGPLVATIERLGRAQELDLWVMRRVFDWIVAHPGALERLGGFSINLSARSLESAEVLAWLHERLADPRVPASALVFEVTETAAIERYDAAQRFVQRVRRHGCRFSLDDFGNGHASFAHLRNLRTDVLKIDGAFVRGIVGDPADLAIVRSMHEVARSLGMRTVAECVETPEILAAVRAIGIDHAQGWAIHRPCPIEALAAVVERERALRAGGAPAELSAR